MTRRAVKLLNLSNAGLGIFQQLELEQALFRLSGSNWCVINSNSANSMDTFNEDKAIVLGLSGKVNELLDVTRVKQDNIPVLRRFTGGGTVIVDRKTFFVSFIIKRNDLGVVCYPRPIMEWSGGFYKPIFDAMCPDTEFRLNENDYCFHDLKFAGNAQAISGETFVHHTSFLFDYDPINMGYLLLPKKRPEYRKDRMHDSFLCNLKDKISLREENSSMEEEDQKRKLFVDSITKRLSNVFGSVEHVHYDSIKEIRHQPHRNSMRHVEV